MPKIKFLNFRNQRSFTPLESPSRWREYCPIFSSKRAGWVKNSPSFLTGFSLIELLIAVGILVLVILVATTISISAIRAQKENKSFREIQDDGRYIMEMMMKEIRMSKIMIPAEDIVGERSNLQTLDRLTVLKNTGETVIYSKNNDEQLIRQIESESLPINSDKVKVTNLKFYISSIPPLYIESDYYRRVTLVLRLESKDGNASLNLQTTISPRPSPCPSGACAEIIP